MVRPEEKQQQFVTRNMLARLYACSPRWVERLTSEYGMPKAGRNSYDFVRCAMWYARFLNTALRRRDKGTDGIVAQLRRDRIRLVNAQAEKAKLEFEAFEATLVERDKFREWESQLSVAIREELTAMAHRLAPQLVDKNRNQIKALIDSEARATLVTISKCAAFEDEA